MSRFRLMTYNVHRCVGPGGGDSIADITALCRDADADIIALQELDAPATDQDEGAHHARDLAAHLGMELLFCRTFRRGVGYYGHALLSRDKLELKRVTTFGSTHADAEPRGAIWARATIGHATVEVISTHLGVYRKERGMQSRELVGEHWLSSPEMGRPLVLCGDLNAVPRASTTYRRFASRLRDAQRVLHGHRPRPTFPSRLPILRLDHVFVSEDVDVLSVEVPYSARSRRASDHLPLITELELKKLERS